MRMLGSFFIFDHPLSIYIELEHEFYIIHFACFLIKQTLYKILKKAYFYRFLEPNIGNNILDIYI